MNSIRYCLFEACALTGISSAYNAMSLFEEHILAARCTLP